MSEKELKIDKTKWGKGPWQNEPDRIEWRSRGLPCLIVRTPMGNLCGYVAVAPDHPYFEKNYIDLDIEVHGGLTYSDHCQGFICHVPEDGEYDNVWWLGFDCAHHSDYIPKFYEVMRDGLTGTMYRNIPYVVSQVEGMVDQLVEADIDHKAYDKNNVGG